MAANEVNQSENLIKLINRLILEKHYDGIFLLLQEPRNTTLLADVCSEAIEICKKFLQEDVYQNNMALYSSCEQLLKSVAQHAGHEEVLFELIEIVETTKSENAFTSALKALQICLLRFQKQRTRALEWALNSINSHIKELEVPKVLLDGYDEKEEKFLEQDDNVHRILTSYITIFLFYEPLYKEQLNVRSTSAFRDTTTSKKNVLVSFMVQLLGKPLALLDLSNKEGTTNCYSLQCAKTLANGLSALLVDPFFPLAYIEARSRWSIKASQYSIDGGPHDIFFIDEKMPLQDIGIYYYMLLVEDLIPESAPKVYRSMYIFEMCLYLVVELLKIKEPAIHYKGLRLGRKVIESLENELINCNCLELKVHSGFCHALTQVTLYSNSARCRKLGTVLLKEYIFQFEDKGKYFVLKNLMKETQHSGLLGYIIVLYKDVLLRCLKADLLNLPECFCGWEFKNIVLKYICTLKEGFETDVMDNSEHIISALNVIRCFTLVDQNNRTGIWNFIQEIRSDFLNPLQQALDLSRAHYKAERHKVLFTDRQLLDMTIETLLPSGGSEHLPSISKNDKLRMLDNAMITFDLIESLLARANECIAINAK